MWSSSYLPFFRVTKWSVQPQNSGFTIQSFTLQASDLIKLKRERERDCSQSWGSVMVTNDNDLYGYYNSDLSHIFQVRKKWLTKKSKYFHGFIGWFSLCSWILDLFSSYEKGLTSLETDSMSFWVHEITALDYFHENLIPLRTCCCRILLLFFKYLMCT